MLKCRLSFWHLYSLLQKYGSIYFAQPFQKPPQRYGRSQERGLCPKMKIHWACKLNICPVVMSKYTHRLDIKLKK